MFRREQALIGVGWVAGDEHFVAERKIGGQASRYVGTDGSSRTARGVLKNRPVANVFIGRATSLVGVVHLGQSPDVVIAGVVMASRRNGYLIVEGLRAVGPHFLQPVEAKLRFGGEVRRARTRAHLAGKVAHAHQHHGYGVGVGLDELHVIARVPPAAGGVDHRARRGQRPGIVILGEAGREIHSRTLIVQVSRCGAQGVRNIVRAVALALIKVEGICQRRGIEVCPGINFESDGRGCDGRRHRDCVSASS